MALANQQDVDVCKLYLFRTAGFAISELSSLELGRGTFRLWAWFKDVMSVASSLDGHGTYAPD